MFKTLGALSLGFVLTVAPVRAQDPATTAAQQPPAADPAAPQAGTHPAAIEYSHGYEVRAKIHKYASVAMLPLFAADLAVGQSLYNTTSDSKKSAHVALGAGIGGLFAVNSVTGAWNLIESRKDPNKRGIRLLHGLLMLGADAGFFATAATAPDSEHGLSTPSSDKSAHRAIAITSMGAATASYLLMLFGGR